MGQDTLILKSGEQHQVRLIEIQENIAVIEIKGIGAGVESIVQNVPLKLVDRIILEDGTVAWTATEFDGGAEVAAVKVAKPENMGGGLEKITEVLPGTDYTIADLSSQQKKEYNRNKISIEVIGQSTGNIGGYGSSLFGATTQSTSWYQWSAYQGMGKQLTEAEFFTLTRYDDEAQKAKERTEKIGNNLIFGGIASLGGLIVMYIPKTTTEVEHYEYLGDIEYEVTTYPYLVPGAIVSIIGSAVFYMAALNARKNYAPSSTVQQIADDYNQQLINRIANK